MKQIDKKVLVILGSAREDSNTLKAVTNLIPFSNYEIAHLSNYQIRSYQYDSSANQDDDFIEVARRMAGADIIVFATPVYWYTMSGQMKTFFDRLTDLTDIHKPIGKSLKGKSTYLIACGGGPKIPDGFEIPFRLTSEYFEMNFMGSSYQKGN